MNHKQQYSNQYQQKINQQNNNNQYAIKSQVRLIQELNALPVQQSQSDEDILQKIDSLIEKNQSQKQDQIAMKKKQMLLNCKINELQKIIINLNEENKKLNQKLDQSELRQRDSNQFLNTSTGQSRILIDDLTLMQGDFQQIEGLISQYKEQLSNSQKKWKAMKEEKDEEVQSLKNEIIAIAEAKDIVEKELNHKVSQCQMFKNRNKQLLIEMQNLERKMERRPSSQYSQKGYLTSSGARYQTPAKKLELFDDYKFNQKIEHQMQMMIKKLLKELENEKKNNSKMGFQIKRLNYQMMELEKKLKQKNDTVYQLEMKIILLEKNYGITSRKNTLNNAANEGISQLITTQAKSNKLNQGITNTVCSIITSHTPSNFKTYNSTKAIGQRRRTQDQSTTLRNYEYYYDDQTNGLEPGQYEGYQTSAGLKPGKGPLKVKSIQNLNGGFMRNERLRSKSRLAKGLDSPLKKPQSRHQGRLVSAIKNQNGSSKLGKNQLGAHSQFISFSLMQLQENKIRITMKQKIIIISRLIELYCKKLKNFNYSSLTAEEVQVYNFNQKHPNLIRIRKIDSNSNNSKPSTLYDETEESLMYNLACIVENLAKVVDTVDQKDLEVDLNLKDIIEQILSKSLNEKLQYFQQLSKSLQLSSNSLE